VFFRSDSLTTAIGILSAMANPADAAFGRDDVANLLLIAVYAGIAWFAPNTQSLMRYDHANRSVGAGNLRPLRLYAAAVVLAFGILGIQQHSEFIYFRF
jgi:alginate O-acetyltransferase complex protein AlgI